MILKTAFRTDLGRRRSQNQDNGMASPELGICLVADGMGGHRGGETASRLVVETVAELIPSLRGTLPWRLESAVMEAHRRIYQLSQSNDSLTGMGTTTTLLGVDLEGELPKAEVVHVGDSRCYLLNDGAIWQVTRDHSLVQEKVRAGLIRRDQVKLDLMRNVITRSVGFEPHLQVDHYELTVRAGDLFLLCSDGLTTQLDDREILSIVDRFRASSDWDACARELIELANERGGDDNISVGIMHIGNIGQAP